MSVENARQATEIAVEYVEDVLHRDDLVIDEVVREGRAWVVVLEGIEQDYEMRIDPKTGAILEFRRLEDPDAEDEA